MNSTIIRFRKYSRKFAMKVRTARHNSMLILEGLLPELLSMRSGALSAPVGGCNVPINLR
jgi:hypothetical protein